MGLKQGWKIIGLLICKALFNLVIPKGLSGEVRVDVKC